MQEIKPSLPFVVRHLLRVEARLIPLLSCVAALFTLIAALVLGPSRTLYVPAIFATVWFLSYVIVMRALRDHDDTQ